LVLRIGRTENTKTRGDTGWNVFLGHAAATLAKFQVPEAEQRDVVAFVQSLKKECLSGACVYYAATTLDQLQDCFQCLTPLFVSFHPLIGQS